MELLRRSLLIGCLLPGLWLLRLAPLDPLLSVVPIDFAAIRKAEAERVPDAQKTEPQRRNAAIPLPVYIEETLQYNVYSATGPAWESLLSRVDRGVAPVFFRPDEPPIDAVLDKLGAGGGTTYVSISRPGEDRHYRVDRHAWTRRDFRAGKGLGTRPVPPSRLLYPFRLFGMLSILAGFAFFLLLPAGPRGRQPWPKPVELAALAFTAVAFAAPLVLVGGSVQALTRAPWLTVPCWILAGVGVHLFAHPGRNALDPRLEPGNEGTRGREFFLREGLVFLAMAFGPLAFLVSASLALWNR